MNSFYKTLIIFVLFLNFHQGRAQYPDSKAFNFEYTWGIYEHFMVSSKYEKIYVKVSHPDVYEGTKIEFTGQEKLKVWEELNNIDFFSYPDNYCPQPPKDTLPKFERIELLIPNSDSIEVDTLWLLPKIYELVDNSIPYSEYSITVYLLGKKKTVRWRGDQTLRELGCKKEIKDPKFENLYKVGRVIYNIIEKKKGFKNLPKSNLIYY